MLAAWPPCHNNLQGNTSVCLCLVSGRLCAPIPPHVCLHYCVLHQLIKSCPPPPPPVGVMPLLQLSCFSYGPVSIRIREGALGDGLGAQVWAVAHIMCRWVAGWGEGGWGWGLGMGLGILLEVS
jgi:hypothetical protein